MNGSKWIKEKLRNVKVRIKYRWAIVLCFFVLILLLWTGFKYYEPIKDHQKPINHFKGEDSKNGEFITPEQFLLPAVTPSPKEVVVVIDPGHGGIDQGATFGTFYEKDVNLDISLKMGQILREYDLKVVYTRTEDVEVGLEERAALANAQDATLFISVHNNSMPDNLSYKGTETLYCAPANPKYSKMNGAKLASIVQKQLLSALGTIDNGAISRPNLLVLRKTSMPAVIAEIAYMSNSSEREMLKKESFRQSAANALANGVIKALEVMDAQKDDNGTWLVKE